MKELKAPLTLRTASEALKESGDGAYALVFSPKNHKRFSGLVIGSFERFVGVKIEDEPMFQGVRPTAITSWTSPYGTVSVLADPRIKDSELVVLRDTVRVTLTGKQ